MFKFSICCWQIAIGLIIPVHEWLSVRGGKKNPTETHLFVPVDIKTQSGETGVLGEGV